MKLVQKAIGETLTIRVKGELDLHTASEFRRLVDAELDKRPRIRNLIMNLTELEFIDSSGLGAILGRVKRVQQRGGRTALVGANARISRTLQMSGLLRIVVVTDSEEQAKRLV